jgi:serine/threonine protein kinase
MSYVVTLPKPGDKLGPDYRIDRELDNDGVTALFAATAPTSGARYTLRCFLSQDAADWAAATEQFVQRARGADLFKDRQIVEIFSVHEDRGTFYSVAEWLEGVTLERYIQQHGPIATERALQLLRPCAQALATAHTAGIVHGDLQPRNIFVCGATPTEPERARVQNFGYGPLVARAEFAKHREEGREPRATVPEAAPDKRSARAADLHAFGVMLYQVLSGPSSSGVRSAANEAGAAALPSTAAARGQHIPAAVVDIIARALAVQPAERYASFDEMAEDLAKHMRTRSMSAAARRKGSHATLRWTPAVSTDVSERATIPLGMTAPGGWSADSSATPNNNASARQPNAQPCAGEVVSNGQSASVTLAPTTQPRPNVERVVGDACQYTWIKPASEIEAIEWLSPDAGLEAELSHAPPTKSHYWLLPRWVGHVSLCVSLLAGIAVAIELIARARSVPAERPVYVPQQEQDLAVRAGQRRSDLAAALPTAFVPVAAQRVAAQTSTAGAAASKPAQAGAARTPATTPAPTAKLAAPKPPATTEAQLPAATTRVESAQASSTERGQSSAAPDSLRRASPMPSPAAITAPAVAPRSASQPASPSQPATTTNPAWLPKDGKVGVDPHRQLKTLDGMNLL